MFTWITAIATTLLVVLIHCQFSPRAGLAVTEIRLAGGITPTSTKVALPTLQIHPLPQNLDQWQDANNSGDYFSQIKPTEVGYLVWSLFPIKVYIEQPAAVSNINQAQRWTTAVLQAVQEWKAYLPLVIIEQPETADITILCSAPPLRVSPTGKLPRVRSAETRYELYISKASTPGVLSHRYKIWLSPNQTSKYTKAAARHEFGHALGIWGHSPVATDALYFAQVDNPPSISPRDINTLKQVYAQPTRLGWSLVSY